MVSVPAPYPPQLTRNRARGRTYPEDHEKVCARTEVPPPGSTRHRTKPQIEIPDKDEEKDLEMRPERREERESEGGREGIK